VMMDRGCRSRIVCCTMSSRCDRELKIVGLVLVRCHGVQKVSVESLTPIA
jgi:hypothetical protein